MDGSSRARTRLAWISPTIEEIEEAARVEAERAEKNRLAGKLAKPLSITLCVNSRGTAWTGDGFRSSFFKLIRKLEEEEEKIGPGLTFHGLRHTIRALLKEDGASEEDIAIALGQKTIAVARPYSHEANHRTRMTAATLAFNPMRKNKAGAQSSTPPV